MTEKKPGAEKTPKGKKNAQKIMAERKAAQQQKADKATPPQAAEPEKSGREKSAPEKSMKANWSLRFLVILIVFLLGSGTGLYFLPQIKDRFPIITKWIGEEPSRQQDTAVLAGKFVALEARLAQQDADIQLLKTQNDQLDQRLATLSTQAAAETDPLLLERLETLEQARLEAERQEVDTSQAARIDMLLSRMSQLEASFVPLSKGLADAQEARLERSQLAGTVTALAAQLDQLDNRLSQVEKYAARDNSGALLAFRIGELRRKVTSGQAFGPEINALKALTERGAFAQDSQLKEAVRWLSQHKAGIGTRAKLRDQFDDLIPALIRAQSSHADDPWWQRAYNSGKALITVRKTGTNDIDSLDATIDRAHRMLARLDLKAALELLKGLPGNIAGTLDAWLRQAEIHLQAEEELNRIESLTAAYYLAPGESRPSDDIPQPEPAGEEVPQ